MSEYKKYPVYKALNPLEGPHNVMLDRWWSIDGDYLLFWGECNSPQCNRDRSLALRANKDYEVQYFDCVFIPITWEGYYEV